MSDTIEKIKCLIIGSVLGGLQLQYMLLEQYESVLYQGMQPGGQLTNNEERTGQEILKG
jgi:hypothetical protein